MNLNETSPLTQKPEKQVLTLNDHLMGSLNFGVLVLACCVTLGEILHLSGPLLPQQ